MKTDWKEIAKKYGWDDPLRMIVEMYYLERKSLDEIADHLVVSQTALVNFMKENGLPRREKKSGWFTRALANGPRCPDCGCVASRVRQVVPGDPYRRYRQCKECGRRFVTVEMRDDSSIFPEG